MSRKVDFFFELLAGVYGRAKMHREWPTAEDVQIRNKLWEKEVEAYSEQELKGAIDNALIQQQNGFEEFMWPNVGLILSGCKRYSAASHREFIPPPKAEKVDKVDSRDFFDKLKGKF